MYGCQGAAITLTAVLLLRVFYLWLETLMQPIGAMLIVAGVSFITAIALLAWQRFEQGSREEASEDDHNP